MFVIVIRTSVGRFFGTKLFPWLVLGQVLGYLNWMLTILPKPEWDPNFVTAFLLKLEPPPPPPPPLGCLSHFQQVQVL
jgi:hypothetical protein